MIQETFVIFTIVTAVVYLLKYFQDLHKYYSLLFKLPKPKWTPIIGNLPEFLCEKEMVFQKMRKWCRELGPCFIISSFYFTVTNISGPEEFEIVSSSMKHLEKGRIYQLLHNWLGKGLLTSSGSLWQTRRKILTPAFHFSILRNFVNVFNEETDKLVETLKAEVGTDVNVIPFISQCTLNAIVETSMGCKLDLHNTSDTSYVEAIHEIGKVLFYKHVRLWSRLPFFHLTSKGRMEKNLTEKIHHFTNNIIKYRERNFEKIEELSVDDSEDNNAFTKKRKMAMLDLLLNAKLTSGVIDDTGIKDEVNTIMFEGHDTTSMAISFSMMLLACHRNIQDRVYEEIIKNSQENQKHFTMKELNDLKYMECVIKECLRLYPSVPFIARKLEEDITTPGGFVVPGRCSVYIHIFDIHRNPQYWPEPEKFDPDRFLPEKSVARHPFAYVPFSAGPRNCVGQRYAMLEMKAVLSGILRNFIIEPVDTPETIAIVPDLVLRPKNSCLLVKLVNRN